MESPAKKLRSRLTGILPPLTTPFDKEGNVVLSGVREQIDFMLANKVRGVVVGGSTGEGHTLDRDDFAGVMREANDALAGRLPLVAGLIVDSTREAIMRTQMISGLKISALQITPVHYRYKTDTESAVEYFGTIYAATRIPILIYNNIPWNYLSIDLMLHIMREVPGVIGIKQSAGDLKSVSDLIDLVHKDNLVLSGIDALLYPAFTLGAHGAISGLTAGLPGACVALWDAVQAGDHKTALDLHKRLNALWNVLSSRDNFQACTKYNQHKQGLGFYYPRSPMKHVSPDQKAAIDKALKALPI
jgi:4-hydroxy-tetrahydrodipicolinate synthase